MPAAPIRPRQAAKLVRIRCGGRRPRTEPEHPTADDPWIDALTLHNVIKTAVSPENTAAPVRSCDLQRELTSLEPNSALARIRRDQPFILPVADGDHWVALAFWPAAGTVHTFDPLNHFSPRIAATVQKCLPGFTLTDASRPVQLDTHSCGVWVADFALAWRRAIGIASVANPVGGHASRPRTSGPTAPHRRPLRTGVPRERPRRPTPTSASSLPRPPPAKDGRGLTTHD